MERSPLKSKWAEYFARIHKNFLVRRNIMKELHETELDKNLLIPMVKHYFSCFVSSAMIFYVFRNESKKLKFLLTVGSFSLTYIYIQMFHEENIFFFKGLEDTETGKIIRKNYIESLPEAWQVESFKKKETQLKEIYHKYHYREEPMEKFSVYINEYNKRNQQDS